MTADNVDQRLREADAASRRRDPNKAAMILESLLAERPNDVDILQRLGAVDAQRDEFGSAIAHLERARKIEPKNAYIVNTLGLVHLKLGKHDIAQQYFQIAISINPRMAETHMNLGNLHLSRGNADAARDCYENAIAFKPDFVDALVNLASLHERAHRFEKARPLTERAVKLAPAHGRANLTLAQIELRTGKAQQAAQRLEHLIRAAPLTPTDAALAQYLIGQAADKLGDYDKAFGAFEAGNAALYQLYEAPVASMSAANSPESLRRLHAFFSAEDISAWSRPEKMEGSAPVFLLGFPRSGTTLLDQILSAHSAIVTLEEKQNLVDARNDFIRPAGALEKLGTMTDDEINLYRRKYWARLRNELKIENPPGVVIDKMPLNTIFLGLIYRLFPEAKIIFALRDPRDVVLSCFQQRFGINSAMFQFLKLETAAAYYDQVMALAEIYRARLALNLHVVRYEDVIGDMRKTILDLLAFLDLEWEDAITNYKTQARERWISTPSGEQVVEPLYTSSIEKWRNYRRHLEPVLPVLEPWVKKHGYEPS